MAHLDGQLAELYLTKFGKNKLIKIPKVLELMKTEINLKSPKITQILRFMYRYTSSYNCAGCEDLCALWTQKLVKHGLVDKCVFRIWRNLETLDFIKSTTTVYDKIVAKTFMRKTRIVKSKKFKKVDSLKSKMSTKSLQNRRPSLPLPLITSPPGEEEIPKEDPPDVIALESFLLLRSLIWNGSNCSSDLCVELISKNFMQNMIKILSREDFEASNFSKDPIRTGIAKGLTGVIHNCFRHNRGPTKEAFRACHGVDLMVKYLKSDDPMLSTKASILLAYSIEENELDLIEELQDILQFILKRLIHPALISISRKALGFSLEETLNALTELASSDGNKRKMVELGYLIPIGQIILGSQIVEELEAACRLFWILSFLPENLGYIRDLAECLQFLRTFQNHSNTSIAKSCKGLFWNLGEKQPTTGLNAMNNEIGDIISNHSDICHLPQHIMISYDHQHKDIVRQLNQNLQHKGYNTWLDADKMSGSTLQAMAEAVENASVVIICMSERYKNSPSCRTEAEYAYRLRKDIIPVRTQYKYESDGWLGILIGTKLYFDCFSLDQIEECSQKLANEIDQRGRLTMDSKEEKLQISDSGSSRMKTTLNKFSSWSNEELQNWMVENKLESWLTCFGNIDGSLLLELKSMYQRSPTFFYETLKSMKTDVDLQAILKLTKCLNHL